MEAVSSMQFDQLLSSQPRRWLVTGGAGFIGSHLIETLLTHDQTVVCLDNFSTGHQSNLDEIRGLVGPEAWKRMAAHVQDVPAQTLRAYGGGMIILGLLALQMVR